MADHRVKKYISPMHINGLNGRILQMPAQNNKKRQILLLYGHHASLERMMGLAEVLNEYGAVTMPDLPGFGGMESFYKINQKPTLDNYADYLASIIKLHYKRRKFTIVAMSFAVPLMIRTLQKHPELVKKVNFFVSIAGFAHKDDFIFDRKTELGLRTLANVFSHTIPAAFMKSFILTGPAIRTVYGMVGEKHSKLKDASLAERKRRIDFEVGLWKMNDVRTRMSTMRIMFNMDVCHQKIDLPIYHVTATHDRYFDNNIVKEHFHVIFTDVEVVTSEMPNHAPTTIATAKEAAPYIPLRLRAILG